MARPPSRSSTPETGKPGTSLRPVTQPVPSKPPTLRAPPPSKPDERELSAKVPPPAGSLDEVERALSLLEGRHQDTVRVQRQTQIAIAAKRAETDEAERRATAAQRRSVLVRSVLAVLIVTGVGYGGWFMNQRYRRTLAVDAALEKLAAPFVARGWTPLVRPIWRARSRVEVTLGAHTCIIALSSTSPGDGKLGITRPGRSLEGATSLAYCTCGDERVVLHTGGDGAGGVQLLSHEARAVGGNAGLRFVVPRPESLPVSDECPVDALDAWLASGHGASALSADALAAPTREALTRSGFKLAASGAPTAPFAVVPGAKDTCFLATSTTHGEALALRLPAGERPLSVASGVALAMGWCAHTPQPVTVWRDGTGTIVVFAVPSGAVAGTLGLREVAAHVGLGDLPIWAKPTELGWDASTPLLASAVAPADITLLDAPRSVPRMHVVSLTLGSAQVTPVPDEIDRYACAPPLESHPEDALCVQSSPLAWTPGPGMKVGIAEAPLPFWMDILTQVDDRRGLGIGLQLLGLSRHLAAEGYEATARAGVFEERSGVEVIGRAGDDQVIVIGLLSTDPWVLPYTEDAGWTLDGEPHTIPIEPGNHLHLTTRPWTNVPPEARRTVVFRHKAAEAAAKR